MGDESAQRHDPSRPPALLSYAAPTATRQVIRWVVVGFVILSLLTAGGLAIRRSWLANRARQTAIAQAAQAAAKNAAEQAAHRKMIQDALNDCANFEFPIDEIIYNTAPPGLPHADPACWTTLKAGVLYPGQEFGAGRPGNPWKTLLGVHARGLCFLHARQAGDRARIIGIRCDEITHGQPVLLPFMLPLTGTNTVGQIQQLAIALAQDDACEVAAGRIDPDVLSKWTIAVKVNGQTTLIDGQFTEDDQLLLTPRAGPVDPDYIVPLWIPPGSRWTRPAPLPNSFPGLRRNELPTTQPTLHSMPHHDAFTLSSLRRP